ncbi:hypothetical protein JTE90_010805 [Oedothorax gibbosus]|uniref:Uncharacterized protein n=1 Tax=Oedothorax gibbosus TaxID=931172 RepID=A0AAV6VHF6_9ARAC|nr:hypothetical protein JTE90_010805 [Oedothorax gibbosus]
MDSLPWRIRQWLSGRRIPPTGSRTGGAELRRRANGATFVARGQCNFLHRSLSPLVTCPAGGGAAGGSQKWLVCREVLVDREAGDKRVGATQKWRKRTCGE